MPLNPGHSKKTISHNIHEMVAAGHSQKQAVAASLHNADKYSEHKAEGGEVGDEDHEIMMDGCAQECMEAIESKDKAKFRSGFEALVADLLMKMGADHDD